MCASCGVQAHFEGALWVVIMGREQACFSERGHVGLTQCGIASVLCCTWLLVLTGCSGDDGPMQTTLAPAANASPQATATGAEPGPVTAGQLGGSAAASAAAGVPGVSGPESGNEPAAVGDAPAPNAGPAAGLEESPSSAPSASPDSAAGTGVAGGLDAGAPETGAGDGAMTAPADADDGQAAPSAGCTRESLTAVIDQYFEALVAHDPSQLPLAANVKFTENAELLEVGDGLWQTASALTFHRNLLDTERCGSLTQAVLEEEGEGPIIFGVRLGLVEQQITEIETYIARSTEFFQTPEGVPVMDGEEWESILDPEERSTREELNAAADAYFDFFADQSTPVPFASPCDRWENGFRTTRGDCSNLGGAGGLRMTNRRYPVADVEAGIGVGFILFAGSLLDFHMFKVRNGEITQIQAVVGPMSRTSGWEEQEEGD